MKIDIEKIVLDEVKSSLSEIDLDSITDPSRIRAIIKAEVDRQVIAMVSEELQLRLFKSIKEKMPIVDASVNEIVRETLYRVDSLINTK